MLNKPLLAIFACPKCKQPLEPISKNVNREINTGIESGKISNKLNRPLHDKIEGGFFCNKHSCVFPILEGIPLLLIDESILL